MRSVKANKGFTLIELMIVVAIVGIIAAIAYPSYTEYVERARRSDAQGALMGLAAAMERHRASNGNYQGAASGGGNTGAPAIFPDEAPIDGSTKYYDLTIDDGTTTGIDVGANGNVFALIATPKNAQAGDGILTLDHTGRRGWDENNDGDTDDAGENDWEK